MTTSTLLLSIASAFCFALALVMQRFGLRSLSPMQGARISLLVSAIIAIGLAIFVVDYARWNERSALLFALVGLFFPAGVTLLTYMANRRIGPSLTGALGNLTPIFAVLFAMILLREAPTVLQLAGLAAVSAGIALLFIRRGASVRAVTVWIMALPVVGAVLRGLAQPVVKLGLEDWPEPFAVAAISFPVSAVLVLSLAHVVERRRARLAMPSDGRWRWFVAVGTCNSTAVILLYLALRHAPITQVAPIVACYPLFTVLMSRLAGDDQEISRLAIAGIMLMVGGVILVLL